MDAAKWAYDDVGMKPDEGRRVWLEHGGGVQVIRSDRGDPRVVEHTIRNGEDVRPL